MGGSRMLRGNRHCRVSSYKLSRKMHREGRFSATWPLASFHGVSAMKFDGLAKDFLRFHQVCDSANPSTPGAGKAQFEVHSTSCGGSKY